ncbi:MAG: alpha/beta fold hydrolase [Clostridium sp.]|uniref:alpha/beta fold hydrolase n=1 Tax=Clostridium sp. DSM 8431 TaxID=1761781 RepID=UPI0008EBD01A|nr:alpha/beta fold hydrolase [Clostridium sp. DSM 8431]MCR4943757.1 alpha/beta fold hydrolase [Clostridium sp.]SFU87096.1 alpha/beta hydrolase fold [Clostridium sp. DSM 8431]
MGRKQVIKENKVSEIHSFNLGGYNQKVLIEGKSKDLPIVITFHGGPGSPLPFSVGARGMFPEFTEKFIMVYWDQLGCGINNYPLDKNFTIDKFATMAIDLINNIKSLFPSNKLYVFATSWGSILSAKVLERCPNIVNGVVVSGQIIKDIIFNDEVINALSQTKLSKDKIEAIRKINTDNFTFKDLEMISDYLRKYTYAYTNKKGKQISIAKLILGLMMSPDYKFKDFKAVMKNGYTNNTFIWNGILNVDLSRVLKEIEIPYIILQGDTDIIAPTSWVKELVDRSSNSNLKCYVVENTGHIPGQELVDRIIKELLNLAYVK